MEEENSSRNKNLFDAVEKEDKELVQALLQNQKFLDVNCQFEEKVQTFFFLLYFSPTFFVSFKNVSFLLKDGATALHKAAEKGFEEIMKILLEHGANPDLQDKVLIFLFVFFGLVVSCDGEEEWDESIYFDKEKLFFNNSFFLKGGRVALRFAAEKGFKEIVKILLEHGANTNLQDQVLILFFFFYLLLSKIFGCVWWCWFVLFSFLKTSFC